MNQLQLFALDHYQLRFLDIFVFSFGLVSWEVLKYFVISLVLWMVYFRSVFFLLFFVNIGRLNDRYDF
ncbi:unnamed protein product [Rhizophagus irregularis]|uniref:Uncharacterized protein n=1 Tax=Rhizophagus irregularis TaxID=588596 RepID=A0A916ED19_9GLOM|nr:unnamed protein product [Rhizophagus irregularis]